MSKAQLYDAAIVGGGPCGASLAFLLAKAGFRTAIFEEHARAGIPVHCAGIVSKSFIEYCRVPSEMARSLSSFRLNFLNSPAFSDNHIHPCASVTSASLNIEAFALNRAEFDRLLLERAKEAGAECFIDTRIVSIDDLGTKTKLVSSGGDLFEARIACIAAGSVNVLVAKCGFEPPRNYWGSWSEGIAGKLDHVDIWISNLLFSDTFGYIMPSLFPEHGGRSANSQISAQPGFAGGELSYDSGCKKRIRFGVVASSDIKRQTEILADSLMAKGYVEKLGGISYRPLPCSSAKSFCKGNLALIGDAAGHCKSTTCGGLAIGIRGAEMLAGFLIGNGINAKSLKLWEKAWRKKFGFEQKSGHLLRNVLRAASPKSFANLAFLSAEKINAAEHFDFDEHGGFIQKCLADSEIRCILTSQALNMLSGIFVK